MKKVIGFVLCAPLAFCQWVASPTTGVTGLNQLLDGKLSFRTGVGVPAINCTAGKDVYTSTVGDVYWCTATNTWTKMPFNALLIANNLSDLASAPSARTNLGLGSAATHPSTDFQAVITGAPGSWPATFPPVVPTSSTLGGTKSIDCTGTGHLLKIDTTGTPACSADAGGGGTPAIQANGTGLGNFTTLNIVPTVGIINVPTLVGGIAALNPSIDTAIVPTKANLVSGANPQLLVSSSASGTLYTALPGTAVTAYSTGQSFEWTNDLTNSGTTPSLNVSTLGAVTLTQRDGTALSASELVPNTTHWITNDGSHPSSPICCFRVMDAGLGGGSVTWGSITGTLSSQTDLNTALGLKAPLASPAFTGTATAVNLTVSGTCTGCTGSIPTQYKVWHCTIITGDPGAASPVLISDNDSPVACQNNTGADVTITGVSAWADAGSPTVTPILTGGSGTSILTGALTAGTASWAAGTLTGTPVLHSFSANDATCSATPCTIDSMITAAGGTAKYLVVQISGTY